MKRLAHAFDRPRTIVLLEIAVALFLILLAVDGKLEGFEIPVFFFGTVAFMVLGAWLLLIAVCFAALDEDGLPPPQLRVSRRDIARFIEETKRWPART